MPRRRKNKEVCIDIVLLSLRGAGMTVAQANWARQGAEQMYDLLDGVATRKLRTVRREHRAQVAALEMEVARLQNTLRLRPGRPRVFDDDGSHVVD